MLCTFLLTIMVSYVFSVSCLCAGGQFGTFWLYSGVCLAAVPYIILVVPETKDRQLVPETKDRQLVPETGHRRSTVQLP